MSSAWLLVWTTCLSTWLGLLWAGSTLSHLPLIPVCVARGRARRPDDDERLSRFLGCGELTHSLSQSHEERDLLYQGLDAFPLSASKEPGPDHQKNNWQLASSWQAGRAADIPKSTG